jgi:hypothetical protein
LLFDDLEVTLTPAAREYCHIIRFPQAWIMPRTDAKTGERLSFNSTYSGYEFRVEGLLGTRFLVAGITDSFPPAPYYTSNMFSVDLSNPAGAIRPAGKAAWDASTVVPFTRRSAFSPAGTVPNDRHLDFHGFQFSRSGAFWAQPSDYATRLSPDEAWLVLQSDDLPRGDGPTPVYFDFYNAETGKKIVTIAGTFSTFGGDVDHQFFRPGWLTERYFIVGLGRQLDRCLVCEFGKTRKPGAKQ